MRRCGFWLGLLVLVMGCLPGAAVAASSLVVAFSAAADGEFDPCGCPGSPMGGFTRRATLLQQMVREGHPLVVLDAGNLLLKGALTLQQQEARGEVHARLMGDLLAATGTQAVAVGPRDLWGPGTAGLKQLAQVTGVPWLSANLVDSDGAFPFPPSITLKAGELRVGVIGITEPIQAVAHRHGLRFIELGAAIRAQAARLEGKVDLLVALSNLPQVMNEELRVAVPGLDLILTGPPGPRSPLVPGPKAPWLVHVHGEGRYLARLDLRLTPGLNRPLSRSRSLEQRLIALDVATHSLESLRQLIIVEEGKPNESRLESEGAFLRSRIETLSREPALDAAGVRMFAHRELGIIDKLEEDPAIVARIEAYRRAMGKKGPAKSEGVRPDGLLKQSRSGVSP